MRSARGIQGVILLSPDGEAITSGTWEGILFLFLYFFFIYQFSNNILFFIYF